MKVSVVVAVYVVVARYIVNEFYLYHERSADDYDRALDLQMMENIKNKIYKCKDGIYFL